MFQNGLVYKVERDRVSNGYPQKISKVFRGVPNNINAAFIYKQGAYFISQGVYYKADLVYGRIYTYFFKTFSPFKNSPKRIDGVFSWPNVYTEMFSGRKYYQAGSNSEMVYHKFKNNIFYNKYNNSYII